MDLNVGDRQEMTNPDTGEIEIMEVVEVRTESGANVVTWMKVG